MRIHNLKVNGVREPLGYEFDYLTFSWELSAVTIPEDITFMVQISTDSEFQDIIWEESTKDTFNLLSTGSNFLKKRTRYFWRVLSGEISTTSFFETAKLNEAWTANWITYREEACESVRFKKQLNLRQPVKSARIYMTGLGLYELEIDSQKVGKEFLTPGYHSYDLVLRYQTYDVTDILSEESEISIILGNGWYKGRFVFGEGFENIYGFKQKVIAEVHVVYCDGTTEVIGTDESWQSTTSNIKENSIYDGEIVDFNTDIRELTTVIDTPTNAPLKARLDLPVEVAETFQPQVFRDKANNIILDYGQIITGWISGMLPARRKEVRFSFAELLQNDIFYADNLRTAKQEFLLLNNGEERVVRPHFTYFGFRYVKVEGLTEEEAEKFKALALQSVMDETFNFHSSNSKLNQLVSNIRWSQKDNFLSIPTDCPQRDERMGWTGDITIFANTASYNMETRAFLGNFLNCIRLEQEQMEGAVPFFAPYPKITPFEGINPFLVNPGSAVWGDAGTVLPITIYRHFRDKGLLQMHLPIMTDWVDYIYHQDEKRGGKRLWDFGLQLGDWLALDTPYPQVPLGATDSCLIASVYYYLSATYTAQAASILEDDRADFYHQLAFEIRQAILLTYFDGDFLNEEPNTLDSETEKIRQAMAKGAFGITDLTTKVGTQTGLSLLLRYGLYPSENARRLLTDQLLQALKQNVGFLDTGFVGTPALPHALAENGLEKEAFDLLFNETMPSWLFEVNLGATTTWERWNSLLPDGSISGNDMNSMNHYAYGAVEDFIIEKLLGINLPEVYDDSATYIIKPYYTSTLDWVEGSLQTVNGRLSVNWELKNNAVLVKVTVPVRTRVQFVKSGGETCLLTSGKNIFYDNHC